MRKFTWSGPNVHGLHSSLSMLLSLSLRLYYGLRGEFPTLTDRVKDGSDLLYKWFCTIFWHYLKLDTYSPFLGLSLRTMVKKNPSSGQNFKQYTWSIILLGRGNDQACNYTSVHMLWLLVWMDGHEFGKMIGKLEASGIRKNLSEWVKYVEISVPHVNVHQKVITCLHGLRPL